MRLWSNDDGAPVFVADVPPWHPLTALVDWTGHSALLAPAAALLVALAFTCLLRVLGARRRTAVATSFAVALLVAFLPSGIALLILALATSIAALEWLAREPSRLRWTIAAAAFALATLGTAGPRLLWLFMIGAWLLAARPRKSPWSYSAVAAAASAIATGALLAAPWWMPALELSASSPPPPVRRAPPGRFFSVRAHAVVHEPDRAGQLLRSSRDPRALATVDHVPAKIQRLAGDALGTTHSLRSVRVTRTRGGDASIAIGAGGWALIVSSEPWWPGWRAYWNGERMPPVLVNAGSVGAFVPPGEGTLDLRYRPDAFDDGIRTAGLGLLFLGVTLVWPWYLRIAEPAAGERRGWRLPMPGGGMSAAATFLSRFARVAAWLLLVAYGVFLFRNGAAIAGGSDSSGYMNHARLLLEGNRIAALPLPAELGVPAEDFEAFVPLGFAPGTRPGTMVPSYPPGVPLHLAGLWFVFGSNALRFLGPLAAVAAVMLTYLTGREIGLPRSWSFWSAAVLALSATFVMHSVVVMSDVLATSYSLAAILGALMARKRAGWGILAGCAFGISVLVRPTQMLLVPALALAIGFRWRALLAFAAAAAPFGAIQAATGTALWGGALRTGYGSIASLVSLSFFKTRFLHYAHWLAALFTPLVFPLGLAGLGVRSIEAWRRAILVLWFLPFFIFYCFYGPYEWWWYTRFLLPALPPLLFLAFSFARAATEPLAPARRRIAAALVILAILGTESWHLADKRPWLMGKGETIYPRAVAMAGVRAGPRPIVLGMQLSGAYFHYRRETMVRWDLISPDRFARLRAHAAISGRRWYALLADHEIAEAFAHAPGNWVEIARTDYVSLYELRP